MAQVSSLSTVPLTSDRWIDFEQLFGPQGACGGCWCMYWKLRGKAFFENSGENARQMQKSYVNGGKVPGLVGYLAGIPIGWIAVEPRIEYHRLAHSRILKRVVSAEVWSMPCFFVAKAARMQGLTVELLKGTIEYVRQKGGKILEGYPVDKSADLPPVFAFTGLASAFRKAGFKEVARRSDHRPIFRFHIE